MPNFGLLVLDDPRITAFVAALRRNFVNGGALFTSFDTSAASADWFLVSPVGSLADTRLATLLGSSVLSQALPELGAYRGAEPAAEYLVSLLLEGDLAHALVRGGAYERFEGTAAEAKRLAAEFCSALFDDRYLEIVCYKIREGWSDWFRGDWDGTWIIVDRTLHRVHVLCTKDTDV